MRVENKIIKIGRCPVCGLEKRVLLFSKEVDGISSKIYKCRNCGLVYNGGKLSDRSNNTNLESKWVNSFKQASRRWLDWSKAYIKVLKKSISGKDFLDVGSGLGVLMRAAQIEGLNATGVDPFLASYNVARQQGLNVKNSALRDANLKNSFDLITAIEVVEHFDDPVAEFKEMARLLKREGLIVIQTANQDSLAAWIKGKRRNYYYYDHLIYFSPKTLSYALEKADLKIVGVYAGIVPFIDDVRSRHTLREKWNVVKIHFARLLVFNYPVLSSMTVLARHKSWMPEE